MSEDHPGDPHDLPSTCLQRGDLSIVSLLEGEQQLIYEILVSEPEPESQP